LKNKIILTTVFGFIGFIGTIWTDVTDMMIRYACHIIRTQKVWVCWTTVFGNSSKVFWKNTIIHINICTIERWYFWTKLSTYKWVYSNILTPVKNKIKATLFYFIIFILLSWYTYIHQVTVNLESIICQLVGYFLTMSATVHNNS